VRTTAILDEDNLQKAMRVGAGSHGVPSANEPARIHTWKAPDIPQVFRRKDAGRPGRSACPARSPRFGTRLLHHLRSFVRSSLSSNRLRILEYRTAPQPAPPTLADLGILYGGRDRPLSVNEVPRISVSCQGTVAASSPRVFVQVTTARQGGAYRLRASERRRVGVREIQEDCI
jgi:hypothetical protein